MLRRRRERSLLDEVHDALIGGVEILWADASVIFLPRKTLLVGAALIEGRHVGVEAGDDLDDVEAFGLAVLREGLELIGKMKAFGQAHPPGVAEPEEGLAVSVLEIAAVVGNAHGPVQVQRVFTSVCDDFHGAIDAAKASIRCVRAFGTEAVGSDGGRGVTDFPALPTRPESGGRGALYHSDR
jgi:hypothetical protein